MLQRQYTCQGASNVNTAIQPKGREFVLQCNFDVPLNISPAAMTLKVKPLNVVSLDLSEAK